MVEGTDVAASGKRKKRPSLKAILLILVVVASLGAAVYFWQEAETARGNTPEAVAEKNAEDTERVLNKVNSILLTVSDEEPTVARIENAETLRNANEDFYGNAQNGDYLILYTTRAIIYREAENRLINVAPIVNTSQIQQQAENAAQ